MALAHHRRAREARLHTFLWATLCFASSLSASAAPMEGVQGRAGAGASASDADAARRAVTGIAGVDPVILQAELQAAMDQASLEYNCTMSVGFVSEGVDVSAASGFSDKSNTRRTQVSDRFVWGSVTKTLTGASILKLVEDGLVGLDDTIAQHVDPLLARMKRTQVDGRYMNYTTVEDLWGPDIAAVSIRMLGKMMAGVPDFDTAVPKTYQDPFRATLYANPSHEFQPPEILSLPWVYTGTMNRYRPGSFGYSSTNFILLGLILAAKQQPAIDSWIDFQQASVLPQGLATQLAKIAFGTRGDPLNYTQVHGYDMTSYNGKSATTPFDVSETAGVFSGWTASDVTGSPSDIAKLTHGIYGTYAVASQAQVEGTMVPKANESIYGFATFNLTHSTGVKGPKGQLYGHLGATYGYQSVVAHSAYYNFSIAIGSNIETNFQPQPTAALCYAFNAAKALIEGFAPPKCKFTQYSYYLSFCTCR